MKTYASVHLGGRKPGAALFTVVQSPEMEPGPTGRRAELWRAGEIPLVGKVNDNVVLLSRIVLCRCAALLTNEREDIQKQL